MTRTGSSSDSVASVDRPPEKAPPGPLAGAFASSARPPFERGAAPYLAMMVGILTVPLLGSLVLAVALAMLGLLGALIVGNGAAAFFIFFVLPLGVVTIGLCLIASPVVVALTALLIRGGQAGQASAALAGAATGAIAGLAFSAAFAWSLAGLPTIFGYLVGVACGLAGRARLVARWPEIEATSAEAPVRSR